MPPETSMKSFSISAGELVDSSPIPTFVIDCEHRVRHWNRACVQAFGIAAERIEGTCDQWRPFYAERRPLLADLVVSGCVDALIDAYYPRKCRASRLIPGSYEGEDFFPGLKGGTWLHFTAAPLHDEQGQLIGAIETIQDITESKRAKEVLQLSEARLRATIENTGDVMILWLDEKRRVVLANRAVGQVLGRSSEALLGQTPAEAGLFAAGSLAALDAKLDRIERGEPASPAREFQATAGDGSLRVLRSNVYAIPAGTHAARHALLAVDVTAARQAESALRREHAHLKNIIDHFPGGITLMDENLRIVHYNETYRRILDLPRELLSEHATTLEHVVRFNAQRGDYGPGETEDHVRAMLARAQRGETHDFERTRPDGTIVQVKGVPLPQGGFVSTYTDVTASKQTERQLEALLEEHRAIFDNAHVGIAYIQDRVVLRCNQRMAEMYGYADPEALAGNTTALLYPSIAAWRENGRILYRRLKEHGFSEDEVLQRRSDGSPLWCYRVGRPLDPTMPQGGSIWVYSDVTRQRQQKEQLELARTVFDHSSEALVICDADNRIVSVNRAFASITQYGADEVVGKSPSVLKSGRHDREFYRAMWDTLLADNRWEGEIWDRRKNGEIYPKWLSISVVRDESGAIVNFIAAFADITRRRQEEERAQFLARHDALTGLPNRSCLRERFDQAAEHALHTGRPLALLLLDLDHFKRVNDSLGHPVGDALLIAVAERLRGALYGTDIISRQGGDEFVSLLEHMGRDEEIIAVARKIEDSLEAPVEIDGHVLSTSFSIGVAVYPDDGRDFDTLLQKADTAMYHAKESGRGTFSYFDEKMNTKATEHLVLHGRLRQALGRDEFRLFYQPQIELHDGRIYGAEALLRWIPHDGEAVGPDRFIPVAEESGLILPFGEWVIHQAFRQARRWQDAGIPLRLSINISGLQIYRTDLIATLAAVQRDVGVPPTRIELELTESTLMEDVAVARDVLAALKSCGYSVAIDDFGTGYSSLAYLKKFPLDKLKIDRSFITDLCTNLEDQAIARSVIQIAHSLNLQVVAEGVETAEQCALLRRHGCHKGQGYLFGRPVPANELVLPGSQGAAAHHIAH